MLPFDQQYQDTIKNIAQNGIEETNQRTGQKTKSLPGITIQTDLSDSFPILTLRKLPLKIFIAEQIWFIMGSRKPDEFLSKYTKIWDAFTNIGGVVTTSYGHRMRHHFGRDQLKLLIDLLKKDPTSRHGVIMYWDPADDGLGGRTKQNVPCPYTWTANIIGGKLNFHLMQRSCDMFLGFPHDYAGHALMAQILAAHLQVEPGIITHSISNAHIYENQYQAIDTLISRKNNHNPIKLNCKKNYFNRAEKADHQLVTDIYKQIKKQYHPDPAIKNIKVVL